MLTRCPYPACQHRFELESGEREKICLCPSCRLPATFKPLEILQQLDVLGKRRRDSGLDRGGPDIDCREPPPLSALIEDVRSLWNVGSIFRTADGAGFSLLHLCGITGCPPRQEIAKTSLGAENSVSWRYHTGALEILPSLKRQGVQVIGLEYTTGSEPLTAAAARGSIRTPLCLAVGNEVTGLALETLAHCDLTLSLPMRGSKESLNVAVAYGIAAYRLVEYLAGTSPVRALAEHAESRAPGAST